VLNCIPAIKHKRPLILDDVYELSVGHDAFLNDGPLRRICSISVVGPNNGPLGRGDARYPPQIIQNGSHLVRRELDLGHFMMP
jgi:hypothetical protein